MATSNNGSRSWIFTINNFTEADVARITAWKDDDGVHRAIAGKEVGASGTPHLQGAIVFRQTVRPNAAKAFISPRAHIEKMRGRWIHSQAYCSKDADLIIDKGRVSHQGRRQDIIDFRDSIQGGASSAQLLEEHPLQCCLYQRFIGFVRSAQAEATVLPLPLGTKGSMGIWIWGPSDTGKSTWASRISGSVYFKPTNKWWDGYAGDDTVVIDDPKPDWNGLLMGHIKAWVNEIPFRGEVKGNTLKVRFKKMVVCCNHSPESYFKEHFESEVFHNRFRTFFIASRGDLDAITL